MKDDDYKTYRIFNDYGMVAELVNTLVQNQIEYTIENNSISFDPSFANNTINQEYRVKLKPEDFIKANAVLEKEAHIQVNEDVDNDYYLFAFSNEELIQLIAKRDEWSDFDFILAQKILEDRGVVFKVSEIATLEEQRLEDLSKPQEVNPSWIYAGFLFALLGGVFGIMMGWFISSNTKTLSNGKTVYCYSNKDRRNGRLMLIIGIVTLITIVVLKVLRNAFP